MVKPKTKNKKKMVRITAKMSGEIIKMRKAGLSLRKIARAMDLTHPAVIYHLNVGKNK